MSRPLYFIWLLTSSPRLSGGKGTVGQACALVPSTRRAASIANARTLRFRGRSMFIGFQTMQSNVVGLVALRAHAGLKSMQRDVRQEPDVVQHLVEAAQHRRGDEGPDLFSPTAVVPRRRAA